MDNFGQYSGNFPQYSPPPNYVSPDEKRRIRKNYNTIGIVLLCLYILISVVCTGGYIIYGFISGMSGESGEILYDENGMMILSFWETFIGGGFPAISAMIIFAFYCIISHYDPKELFDTSRIKAGETVRYIFIVLFCQQVSLICSMIMMSFLDAHGLEVSGLDYVLSHDPKTYFIDIIATVVLAPIGEELIYRGIVLRCAAKISGRFAIFFSAAIFGLMHGNPYQMVLGFLIGIPLAIITLKTGSIVPSIICHMANNIMASIPTVVEYFDETMSNVLNIIAIPIFFLIGIVVLLTTFLKGGMRLPQYNEYHKNRTFPILITSWSMIVITIIYLYDIITSIQPIENVLNV